MAGSLGRSGVKLAGTTPLTLSRYERRTKRDSAAVTKRLGALQAHVSPDTSYHNAIITAIIIISSSSSSLVVIPVHVIVIIITAIKSGRDIAGHFHLAGSRSSAAVRKHPQQQRQPHLDNDK